MALLSPGTYKAQTRVSHSRKIEKERDSDKSIESGAKENIKNKATLHFKKLLEGKTHLGHLLDLPNKYNHLLFLEKPRSMMVTREGGSGARFHGFKSWPCS